MSTVYSPSNVTPTERALLLCVRARRSQEEREELQRIATSVGPVSLLSIAKENRVDMLTATVLAELVDLPSPWVERLARNEERVRRTLDALVRVVRVADAVTAHMVVEGGAVLLSSELPERGFGAGDVDVVVTQEAMPAVAAALTDAGFLSAGRPSRQDTARVEYSVVEGGLELWLTVGVRAFGRNWAEDDFLSRESVWIANAVPAREFDDLRVPQLDQLVAMCATHTSTHSFVRSPGLRLHVDVDRLAWDNPIEWGRVVAELLAMRAARRGFVSLAMARDLLQTPVPSSVDDALAPSPHRLEQVRRLLQRAGVFSHQPGVRRVDAALLDALLTDGAPLEWARRVLLPSREWLQHRYALTGSDPGALLHLRRIKHVLRRVS